jgi:hypothetical protein
MKAISVFLLSFFGFLMAISVQTRGQDAAPQAQIPSVLMECEEDQCAQGEIKQHLGVPRIDRSRSVERRCSCGACCRAIRS